MWKIYMIALYKVAMLGARENEGSVITSSRKPATRKYNTM
jgi:hypothetical protein